MGRPLTIDELRYGIIGSLALLEFLKAKRGEIPEASIAEYRKNVEPEVAQFEALLRAEGAEQERERIRSLATPIDDYASQMSLVIPYTALSPAPKEAGNGVDR
jgi:hypothetical protein